MAATAIADKCMQCELEEVENSQDLIDWILCSECDGWYHIACLRLDKPFTDNVQLSNVRNVLKISKEDFQAICTGCVIQKQMKTQNWKILYVARIP